VRGDEGDVEAADEEPRREEAVARVGHRPADRRARGLALLGRRRLARRRRGARRTAAQDPRRGSASRTIAAMLHTETCQPKPAVIAPAIGTNTNWPNEPPALTMPLAMPRFSGGVSRAVEASSTDGPAKPAPRRRARRWRR
jgi:hypothetical protein